MEDCLRLLKGERDEQRLAGLLLATKFCKGDDHASIQRVYEAVGPRFLDRLLKTGIGLTEAVDREDQAAYLQLSVTVLAAICRVPEIASSNDMISKVAYILDVVRTGSGPSVIDECYEFLFLVATTSEEGLAAFYQSGGINVLASHISSLPDGSHPLELAIGLVQSILSKLPLNSIYADFSSDLSHMVATIARQFALLHNALKFEALHLLYTLLSSKYAAPLHDALRLMSSGIWSIYVRVGIAAILQNRVASTEKIQALVLAESMMSILGEEWLIDQRNLPGEKDRLPVDRCLLLVLESSRVEVAVLLNELAYLKYEVATNSSAADIPLKQRNLATVFAVVEKIIKLISNISDDQDTPIDERTLIKVIRGLDETMDVVLEFLKDAKEHGQRKGDDILASTRIVGRYLAESPASCKEKTEELLEYLLLIEGEEESSPFYSICFMLPWMCQRTMELEGCKVVASANGLKHIAGCLTNLINLETQDEDHGLGTVFLACDTLINLLLKKKEISVQLEESSVVDLLKAIAYWTDLRPEPSVMMMGASICSLLFDNTSEQILLSHSGFKLDTLNRLTRLITSCLTANGMDSLSNERDLLEIIAAGYARWAGRFPRIEQSLKR
ncbi:hypothetical protein ACHQM5_029470 [Ranunculus cassubicifolius]